MVTGLFTFIKLFNMPYSQNNEEQIIARYFGNKIGTFLDLGANDGITLSNTFALSNKGWKGCLVDASPDAFARLKDCYEHMTGFDLIHTAVGAHNGSVILNQSGEHLKQGDVALLSTIKREELTRWRDEIFNEVTVPCCTFSVLLGLTQYKTFDFISMDIEGMELDVLPQMDLQALGCKMLCVEYNGVRQDEYDALVIPQGYNLVHKNGENLIYTI